MGERDDARREVEQKRERMSRIAHEVSRRITPEYAKERARDMARERAYRMRDSAVESSWLGPLIGAGIGAIVTRSIRSRAHDRYGYGYDRGERDWYGGRYYGGRHEEDDRRYVSTYGYPYPAPYDPAPEERGGLSEKTSELKDRASDMTSEAKDRAHEMKDRMSAKADEMKDRLQDRANQLRERMPDRHALRSSAQEDTALWALGAMALGAIMGAALPVTRRERELLQPAREKVRELGQQAKDMAVEKGTAKMDEVTARVQGRHEDEGEEQRSAGSPPSAPHEPLNPLH
jgi:hypothetical protein